MKHNFKIGDLVYAKNKYWGYKPMTITDTWPNGDYRCNHTEFGIGIFQSNEIIPYTTERENELNKLSQVKKRIKEIEEELFTFKD